MSSAPTPTSPPAPSAGGGTNSTSPPAVVTPPSSSPSTPNTTAPASAPPAVPSASPPAQASTPPPASTTPPPSSTPTTPAVPSSPSPPAGGGSTPAVPSSPSPPSGGGSSSGGGGSTTPSAPTPPSRNSPPTSSNATPTSGSSGSSSSSSGSSGVSTPLVVGVAVGGAVLLIIITLICVCCRRRKRSDRPPPGYYGGPPRKEETYNGGQVQGWHQTAPPPPSDHIVKIPPQPHMSPPPSHASRPPLPSSQPPPPPPPHYSSSGVSSSNYSGPDGGVFLPPPPPPPNMGGFSKNMFTYEELSIATDAFSDANLLGQGGFGYVHRGMLMSGEEIAVKQLKAGSGQGEREFQAEVEIISRVHHKHLVSLIGYCMTGSKRMLVYEFVANNTLEFHLHGKGRPVMAWPSRLKIAIGSARGLAYLHEDCHPKIIHRDIKAANILLDFKFEAKVADFGLAKFSSDTNTHVSTRVMGTFGYMAPEYASSGKLTEKSDVFSYGVMLLEMITGKRPVDSSLAHTDDSLVDWARPLLTRAIEDKTYDALADPRLQGNYDHGEMARMVACAAACVRHSARRRPRMSQVVRALEGDVSLDDLNDGVRPGHSSVYGTSMGSSDYDSGMYREDLRNFRRLALETSQEYASTEYSEPTSEYGQNPSGSSGENPSRETRSKTPATRTPNDSRGF